MMIPLTAEQLEAVANHPQGVECQGEGEERFVIIEATVLAEMRRLIHQKEDLEAILEGFQQMEAGGGMSVEEARRKARAAGGFDKLMPEHQES